MWARPKKLDDLTKLKECLYEEGLPVDEIIAGTQCQSVKDELIFNTTNAVEKGVFGSPTFFVDNEIFFDFAYIFCVWYDLINNLWVAMLKLR